MLRPTIYQVSQKEGDIHAAIMSKLRADMKPSEVAAAIGVSLTRVMTEIDQIDKLRSKGASRP